MRDQARRRDRYLTTYNIHERQTSMPRQDSNPQSQHASGHRPSPQAARPQRSTLQQLNTKCTVHYVFNIRKLFLEQLHSWFKNKFRIFQHIMYGSYNIKVVNAQQAKVINTYKNTKYKLLKTNASIWINQTCEQLRLVPEHAQSHGTLLVMSEQERQCTYNVTLRRLRVTIVTVEKQQVLNTSLCACVHVLVRACMRVDV